MIARHWHGRVPGRHADRFARHLRATGIAEAASLPGYAGARIQRTDHGTSVDFELITYWYNWAAVRQFAGKDLDRAALYPGDEEYELDPAPRVEHRELRAGTVAITGGRVVPVDGDPIDGGTVLITDGQIAAVGVDVEVPADVPVVDAAGCWVLPGLVEAHTHLGIDEEASGWAGDDLNEATGPNGARLRALDGINPADLGFADALAGGVTTAVILPGSANPIGGQAVAVKCAARTVADMVLRDPVGVKSALGENPKRVYGNRKELPSTRLGVAAVIRDAFIRAQDYQARRERGDGALADRDPDLDVLVRVLAGELPWCQHAHRADDIGTAIRLADEFGYRLVLHHGTEAHLMADEIARRGIPVISGPLISSRSKAELRYLSPRNPAILARAGVLLALTTDHSSVPVHFLALQAILAVREGLDPGTALRSITANPAQILGLADRVGALTPGLDGDVVLWSGNPLEITSRALHVFVAGRPVYHYEAEPRLRRHRHADVMVTEPHVA
jgi:imidazolonepropionase-like amidohydrolase